MQKIKLGCDACSAPLQDIDRLDLFKCPYCDWSYIFKEDCELAASSEKSSH